MKKYISFLIVFIFIVGICGYTFFKYESKNKIEDKNYDNNITEDAKELVLYFSATGATKKVANVLKKVTGADIIEIVPEEKYTDDDLNYSNDNSRANKEQKNNEARPKIKNDIDISQYDRIYLGYPIWWGTNPKIILSLLDKYNFDNKVIILFCTSGSSGIDESMNDLKKYNSNIKILGGKRFNSNVGENEVMEWLDSLGINNTLKNIYIKVNDHTLKVDLDDNSSTAALVDILKNKDITINMEDYANFEKVGDLGFSLPTNDKQITTTYGDVILYQGNKLANINQVLF